MTAQTRTDTSRFGSFDPWRASFWIGGQWVAPAGVEEHTAVTDPATREIVGHVPVGSAADVDAAVAAASAALPLWSSDGPAERAEFLARLGAAMRERQAEFAAVISAQMGAPWDNAYHVQTGLSIEVIESYVAIATEFEWDRRLGNSIITHEPIGVVAAITPWNYPLYLIAAKIAPALAAGCAIVLKPSADAPLDAFLLAEVFESVCRDTSIPGGVFNVVSGSGAVVGETLVDHAGVDAVSFTGSTAAGRRVSELAARTIKRVGLELGGKSAAVILSDVADLDVALTAALGNVFYNSGQTCTACTRVLVPAARYAEAVVIAERVAKKWKLGDPRLPGGHLGPIATRNQYRAVLAHIESGVAQGARLLAGGAPTRHERPLGLEEGNWILPTVFADVPLDADIAHKEIFGPVAVLMSFADEAEAVSIANDSIYGLAGAVWSADRDRALSFARRLRTGRVDINGAAFNLLAPTGGYKQSGNGRELGTSGLLEYLEIKAIQT